MKRNTILTLGTLLAAQPFFAGLAPAQESAPRMPEVRKTSERVQDSKPIAGDKKPNVVFTLADNVGYGDVEPYGGGELRGAPTPGIDQLAKEGLPHDPAELDWG